VTNKQQKYALITKFKKWAAVTEFFATIDAWMRKIGASILDFILAPIQGLLMLLSKLPGRVGKLASSGLGKVEDLRSKLNMEITGGAQQGNEVKPINPEMNRNEMLKETIQTNNANVNLNINDPQNRVNAESSSPFVKIFTSSTLATQ
jgi:hypothetical protein